jgi:hypothetical protein
MLHRASDMDRFFGTVRAMENGHEIWKLQRQESPGYLKTVSRELAKYKLDLVGVQEVRWDKGGTEPADDYTCFYGNGNADHHLGTRFSHTRESDHQLRG